MERHLLHQHFENSAHSPTLRTLRSVVGPNIDIVDFCVPINAGFPNDAFKKDLLSDIDTRLKYYPSEPALLARKVAEHFSLNAENVIVGNGSTEVFYFILGMKKRRLLTPVPTFGRWTDAPKGSGHYVFGFERREGDLFQLNIPELVSQVRRKRIDTVIISNPNNPTGAMNSKEELLKLIAELSDVDLIIIDESFLDFSPHREQVSLIPEVTQLANVVVLKSLGKSLGLHGVRLGMMVGNAELIANYKELVPFWNVNGVAEAVIDLLPYYKDTFASGLDETIRLTQNMHRQLAALPGLKVFPSNANFSYIRIPSNVDPIGLRNHLLTHHGFFIRSCGNKMGASARHYRIATRPNKEVANLVAAMSEYFILKSEKAIVK